MINRKVCSAELDSVLLDGYKKHSLPRQRSREDIDSTVQPGRDTGKQYEYRFLFIFFLSACFTSVLVL